MNNATDRFRKKKFIFSIWKLILNDKLSNLKERYAVSIILLFKEL